MIRSCQAQIMPRGGFTNLNSVNQKIHKHAGISKYGSKREILYFVHRSFPAVFIKAKRDFTEIACTV